MKCQILFSGKNKKNIINLSSAENAQRVVKVKKLFMTLKSSNQNIFTVILFREFAIRKTKTCLGGHFCIICMGKTLSV